MPDYSFNACLKNIEDDDYAKFKEDYELGVSDEESEYLLRASIMNHRKFFVEYLAKKMDLTKDQKQGCQVLSSSNQDLSIFNLFIDDCEITPQAWVNIFNLHNLETVKGLVSEKGKPTENLLVILQYALANPNADVHDFAFDEMYNEALITEDNSRANLIDCVCFSGNLKLLERIKGTEDLLPKIESKQNEHIEFSKKLDEYTDLLYKNTAKEKVALTVNSLGLMEHIRAQPDVEDWDIIIQDYLINEDIIPSEEEGMTDVCKEIAGLLKDSKLALLEVSKVSPKDYLIDAKNLLESGKEYRLALDRRIHDISALYVCYLIELGDQHYITSHPLFILPAKKSLIQLGLRKEKDKKQQAANRKSKNKKKNSSKVSLSSKESYKYLLGEHIQSRKEIDDSV